MQDKPDKQNLEKVITLDKSQVKAAARIAAESEFVQKTRLSTAAVCELNVQISTPYFAIPSLAMIAKQQLSEQSKRDHHDLGLPNGNTSNFQRTSKRFFLGRIW